MKKSQTRYAQTVPFFHTTQRTILRCFYKFSQAIQNRIFQTFLLPFLTHPSYPSALILLILKSWLAGRGGLWPVRGRSPPRGPGGEKKRMRGESIEDYRGCRFSKHFYVLWQEHQRGFRNFGCASDGCVALFERSEFAKAVINRRTAENRKRKLCSALQYIDNRLRERMCICNVNISLHALLFPIVYHSFQLYCNRFSHTRVKSM